MKILKRSAIILITLTVVVFSCKKDSNNSSAPNIVGTYTISSITVFNGDGTTTNERPTGCDTSNFQVFAANHGFTNTNACTTSAALGTWTISKDTLIITLNEGGIYSKGILENVTSTSFTTDENAANFAKDKVVFVKP
jgi:hypothetical protein